ncbi:unnamed protein product [Cylicocyclus nassatus]|uniref:Secreted protein n=1 Tax=Cylicocyclus nassatus TaxID=53992 RepID=A0AA36GG40_CYLNA|nr:unnamed protein product [Cylicocyclus nassatus]
MFNYIVLFICAQVLIYNAVVTAEAREEGDPIPGVSGDNGGDSENSDSKGGDYEDLEDDPNPNEPLSDDYYNGFFPYSIIDGQKVYWDVLDKARKDAIWETLPTEIKAEEDKAKSAKTK